MQSAGPIELFKGAEMRRHALEMASTPLWDGIEKADVVGDATPPRDTKWVPQPVNFAKLKSYRNPFHSRCIRIKARSAVGMGFARPGVADTLPHSSQDDPFTASLLLGGMDLEHTGNAYHEVIFAAGGKIATVTWVPAETIEVSENHLWFRHTTVDPIAKRKRVSYFEALPKNPQAGKRYILHTALDGTWSTWYGEPDWLGALDSVMLFDSGMKYNRATFDNNCIPTWLIFLLGVKLDDEHPEDANGNKLPSQREQFMEWMRGNYGGADKMGGAMLIDLPSMGSNTFNEKASVQFQKLQDGPKDGDFLKLLDSCRDNIISSHGVPPRLVGVVSSGSLGGSGEFFGQLLAFREDLKPKREVWDRSLAKIKPYLSGNPDLTLEEFDIEQWRENTVPQLPANPTDGDVVRQAEAILRRAAL